MRLIFYTDLHQGLRRRANTTRQSSDKLKMELRNSALRALSSVNRSNEDTVICLGDLFDRHSNSEEEIKDSLLVVDKTDFVLAGNHDVENRSGAIGSLELLGKLDKVNILFNPPGDFECHFLDLGKTRLVFVPHVIDQELFESALNEAAELANPNFYMVLCLHCNYDLPDGFTSNSTLNLTQRRAAELMHRFHHILLGHVHEPSNHFEGRLKILGNVHPTGFSDISDKRILTYDTEDGVFNEHWIWRKDDGYWAGKASGMSGGWGPDKPIASFIDIEDDLDRGQAAKLVKTLFSDGALAVRLRRPAEDSLELEAKSGTTLENLPQIIETDLAETKPHLLPLWKELAA